ncbi:MAG: hypothetical protein HY905_04135 [Deltaproteobacteria bacterium]|nr:hypothetical protein [Deltaproteobacteria bacterium]
MRDRDGCRLLPLPDLDDDEAYPRVADDVRGARARVCSQRAPPAEEVTAVAAAGHRQPADEAACHPDLEHSIREILRRHRGRLGDGRAILALFERERPRMTEAEIEAFFDDLLRSCGTVTSEAAQDLCRTFRSSVQARRGRVPRA